jgi:mRNA interferase RelE/StbE
VTRPPQYQLVVAPTAKRQLAEQLPESVAFAAYEFIIGPLLDNPHRVGKRLRPPLNDRYSARRGTYRVIYRIDDENQQVIVVGVFSRRGIPAPMTSRREPSASIAH